MEEPVTAAAAAASSRRTARRGRRKRPERDAALVPGADRRRGRARGRRRQRRRRSPACRSRSRTTSSRPSRPTTCGSRILEGYVSPYDATAVRRLRAAGAMMVAKANMDEFAMGSSTEHSAFGRVRHPLDPDRVPGGSSGGSAALVAAGVVPAALGSETGGSVRQPASFCGVVGVKPSYGRVSRYGLVAFGSSLDCISVFGRTVDEAGRVLAAMSGHDPLDATTLDRPPMAAPAPLRDLKGIRIGAAARVFPGRSPPGRRRGDGAHPGRRARPGRASSVDVVAAALGLRRAHLLHRGARRGGRQPRPLRRGALRHASPRPRRRHPRALPGHPGQGLRRRGAAPHSGGHVRAERRATTTPTIGRRSGCGR